MNWFRLVTKSKLIYPKPYKPTYSERVFESMLTNDKEVRVELPARYDVSQIYTRSNGKKEPTILSGGWALHRKSHVKSNGLVVILPNKYRKIREWTIEFKVRFNKLRPMSSLVDFGDWSMGYAVLNRMVANFCQRNGETLYHNDDIHEVVISSVKVTDEDLIDRGVYYQIFLYVDGAGSAFMNNYIAMPDQLKFMSTDDKVNFRDMDGYIDDIFISDNSHVMDDEKYEYKPSKKFLIESYPDPDMMYNAVDGSAFLNGVYAFSNNSYLENNSITIRALSQTDITGSFNVKLDFGVGYPNRIMSKLYPTTYQGMTEIPSSDLNKDGSIDLLTNSLSKVFYECYNITSIPKINDTNNATDMSYMFYNCQAITGLNLSTPKAIPKTNPTGSGTSTPSSGTSSTSGSSKFPSTITSYTNNTYAGSNYNNNAAVINGFANEPTGTSTSGASKFPSTITSYNNNTYAGSNYNNNAKIINGFANEPKETIFDTSNVKSMRSMFYNCQALSSLNVVNWDTSKVTDMNSMFWYCSSLTTLDISNWDTSNVKNMGRMFNNCTNLTTIIGEIDMSSCTDYQNMFYGCTNLVNLKLKNVPANFSESDAGLSSSQYTIVS